MAKPQRKPQADPFFASSTRATRAWEIPAHTDSKLVEKPPRVIMADPASPSWTSSVIVGALVLGVFGTVIYLVGWKIVFATLAIIVVGFVAWGNRIIDDTIDL